MTVSSSSSSFLHNELGKFPAPNIEYFDIEILYIILLLDSG